MSEMIRRIKIHISFKLLIWAAIWYTFLFLIFSATIFWYQSFLWLAREIKSPNQIWTYEKIIPDWKQYVSEVPRFRWFRVSWSGPHEIIFLEKINCGIERDLYVKAKPDVFDFEKLNTLENWKSFPFQPIPWYVYPESATNCVFTSCQTLDYFGHKKKQCFKSEPFDILPAK